MDSVLIIFISLLFSAFFSGMEIAFVSANQLKLELDKKQGKFQSRLISIFQNNPSKYISTMLIGNNVALVVYGIETAYLLEPVIEKYITNSSIGILSIQTIVSTLIILFTAEFLPKTIFRNNPNIALNAFAVPVFIIFIILYPISVFTLWISNIILRIFFRIKVKDNKQVVSYGKVDLSYFINDTKSRNNQEPKDENNIKIFQNALDFSEVRIRECMIPRTEIVAVEKGESITNLRQIFFESGKSKILVYEETIDNIIGYIHHSKLFSMPEGMDDIISTVPIIPESMQANKLLSQFIKNGKAIAIVVDEFGGTAGMVTIEDIIEEIFGEIEDEHDTSDLEEKKINENEYIFSARLEIDYLNEKYNISLPISDEYETLGGLILFHYENIPRLNAKITIDNFVFTILKVLPTRIDLMHIKITDKEE